MSSKKNDCTLISIIGTAVLGKNNQYRTTKYQWNDGSTYETRAFFEAILRSKKYSFSKVILIGTDTSAWKMLLENNSDDEQVELCLTAEEEVKNGGISEKTLNEIESSVSTAYGIPFELIQHSANFRSDNLEQILSTYVKAIDLISSNSRVVLDITHGFRSMPVFLFQALQFRFLEESNKNVEILYGEYNGEFSEVRELGQYWELSQITTAKNAFINQFDGELLAKKIKPYWEKGSKVIKSLSDIVKNNFVIQIPEVISQIKNVLVSFPADCDIVWVNETRKNLEDILNSFKNCVSIPEKLYVFALLLGEKQLYTQAIIALACALESTVILANGGTDKEVGNYDIWENTYNKKNAVGKSLFKKTIEKSSKQKQLDRLRNYRNQVAHGGAKSKDGGLPNAQNAPSAYESYKEAIRVLLDELKKGQLQ